MHPAPASSGRQFCAAERWRGGVARSATEDSVEVGRGGRDVTRPALCHVPRPAGLASSPLQRSHLLMAAIAAAALSVHPAGQMGGKTARGWPESERDLRAPKPDRSQPVRPTWGRRSRQHLCLHGVPVLTLKNRRRGRRPDSPKLDAKPARRRHGGAVEPYSEHGVSFTHEPASICGYHCGGEQCAQPSRGRRRSKSHVSTGAQRQKAAHGRQTEPRQNSRPLAKAV